MSALPTSGETTNPQQSLSAVMCSVRNLQGTGDRVALVRWAGVLSKVLGSYRHKLRSYTIAWRPLHQLIRQQCITPPTEYIGALMCLRLHATPSSCCLFLFPFIASPPLHPAVTAAAVMHRSNKFTLMIISP